MKKKFGLLSILEDIKRGLNPTQIAKKEKTKKQNIDYYVQKLKNLGCIEKRGYGTWGFVRSLKEVKKVPKDTNIGTSKIEIRGHAFIWRVRFDSNILWDKYIGRYNKRKLTFQNIRGHFWRTLFQGRKIWLTKKGLVIYEPMDFTGRSSFEAKGMAVYSMDKLVKALFIEMNIKLRPYKFTTSREHYGMIRHELARQFNERKEKMIIKREDGSPWMWIDDSLSLSELENDEVITSRKVQQFWNDHRKTNFEVTPTFILEAMNGIQQNQLIFDQNMASHLDAIRKLGSGVEELTSKIKEFGDEIKGIKK